MTDLPANLAAQFMERQKGALPDHLGHVWETIVSGRGAGWFAVAPHHMAPNGFLHAGSVVSFADTACGYACVASLPGGASGFTTLELKSNFLGTARDGIVDVEAHLVHGGRMTQVWDAVVTHRESGKAIALFRCTQMILYPKGA